VIQKFKKTVTCDQMYATSSCTGTDLYSTSTYKGFFCDHPPGVKERTISFVDFNGCLQLQSASIKGFVDGLLLEAKIGRFHPIVCAGS
jgi:hypothetical protein